MNKADLKLVINNKPQWEAIQEELHIRIAMAHKSLEQHDEGPEIFRLQGEVRALRSLLQLRDKVNG